MKTFNTVSQLRLSRRNDRHKDTVFFALNCLFPHLERFKIKFISPLCFTISKVDQTEFESLALSSFSAGNRISLVLSPSNRIKQFL